LKAGMEAIIVLVLLAAVTWYVVEGLKARETGVDEARAICLKGGLQFLDESVVQRGIRLVRNSDGRLTIQRTFAFEFSDTGNNRRPGHITLQGQDVTMIHTGLPVPGEVLLRIVDSETDQIG